MKKKDTFMMFVYLGAIARDMANDTCDTPLIAHQANQIPEYAIPENPRAAAEVYLAHLHRLDSRPFRWMLSASRWRNAMRTANFQTGGSV